MKILIAIMIMVLFSSFMIVGCASNNVITDKNITSNTNFTLIYDQETKVVYIKNRTYNFCYCYTPYYSENGNLCKYEDGKLVEIIKDGGYNQ